MRIVSIVGGREYGRFDIEEGIIKVHKHPKSHHSNNREEMFYISFSCSDSNLDKGYITLSSELAEAMAKEILRAKLDKESIVEIQHEKDEVSSIQTTRKITLGEPN